MDHLKPRSADGEHLINHLKCKKLSRTGGPEPTVIGQTQLSPKWVKQVHNVGGLALYNCLFVCLFVCLIVCLFIGINPKILTSPPSWDRSLFLSPNAVSRKKNSAWTVHGMDCAGFFVLGFFFSSLFVFCVLSLCCLFAVYLGCEMLSSIDVFICWWWM